MSNYKDDIQAVLSEANLQLLEVIRLHEESLKEHLVSPQLLVKIKNVLENQRSALEYLAVELGIKFGTSKNLKKYQFPIFDDLDTFKQCLSNYLPGVQEKNPSAISTIQAFQGIKWLRDLRELTNENKHRRLTPQTKEKTRYRNFQGVTWASDDVIFGEGVVIGNTPIDHKTQSPIGGGHTDFTIVNWLFEETGEPVITTLKDIQSGLKPMIDQIEKCIDY